MHYMTKLELFLVQLLTPPCCDRGPQLRENFSSFTPYVKLGTESYHFSHRLSSFSHNDQN